MTCPGSLTSLAPRKRFNGEISGLRRQTRLAVTRRMHTKGTYSASGAPAAGPWATGF